MDLFTKCMIYVMLWWVVIFAVLPFGVRPPENPKEGHAASAPSNPHLAVKFLATTIISFVIWWFLVDFLQA